MSDERDIVIIDDPVPAVPATAAEIAAMFEGRRPAFGYVFMSVREYEGIARRALAAGPEAAPVAVCGARQRFDGSWYVCGLPVDHEQRGVRGHTGQREGSLAWES